ncbi:MAG: S9 family peptidase [Myxococcales bacterium]|nr:S9 family peptidase [Myxococcales bacterium]
MSIFRFAPLALVLAAAPAVAGPGKGLTIDDMLAMHRVGEPAVSPDGRWVALSVRDTDMAANKGRVDLWLAAVDGSSVRRLTSDPANDTSPTWSPDGAYVYFTSSRGGSSQVWRIAVTGGEAEQVTKVPLDVGGFQLFPDGKRLLLSIEVWPDTRTLAASVAKDAAQAKITTSAQVYDSLLFRHWDTWEDGRFAHLFVWSPEAPDDARDLTPGMTTDVPTHPFGGMEDAAIAPDGKTVAYVARVGGAKIAWTTNTDVFLVPSSGVGKAVAITGANLAYDYAPAFSPDGKSLAVLAMARPGFEADRQRITIYDLATKKPRTVTEAWDRSPGSLTWSADGATLYTTADDLGNHALFAVDAGSGKVTTLVAKGTNASPQVARDEIVFVRDTLTAPAELYAVPAAGGAPRAITHFNDARVAKIAWGAYEQFTFTGAKNETVYAYLVKPAGFDPKRTPKVPVAVLIHGGPQGSFGDHFHYRWNPEVFAGHGYAALMIDFHGSTGYGQAFTDAIRGDWGGAPYDDIMAGVDAALKKYSFLDGTRMGAAGASYGGFMINWINGKTDRFKALVCHDGNLDERLAYFDTEELWFPEWEHGGTPYANPAGYAKHNPIDLVANWKTPTLVIHGAKDYRVVDTQGLSTFTALQRLGIPSRLIYFPDENHWVLKPANSKKWHDEVLAWIDLYTAKRGK